MENQTRSLWQMIRVPIIQAVLTVNKGLTNGSADRITPGSPPPLAVVIQLKEELGRHIRITPVDGVKGEDIETVRLNRCVNDFIICKSRAIRPTLRGI